MKDYGIDVFAQCIGGKVVFVRKPLVFNDDRKPLVSMEKITRRTSLINDKSYISSVIKIEECRSVRTRAAS
jgi:hypothetical protein